MTVLNLNTVKLKIVINCNICNLKLKKNLKFKIKLK